MQQATNILSDNPHTHKQFDDKKHHAHQLYDEKGNSVECYQRDTVQRIFTLWQDLEQKTKRRDKKIKEAFDITTNELRELRKELDERKLINNYTKEERQWLIQRVEHIGEKSEEEDKDLEGRVMNLEKAVIVVAENDKKQEKILYGLLIAIITFFITFGYKTLFMGI